MRPRPLALVVLSLLAAGCSAVSTPPPPAAAAAADPGHAFVRKACAGCHAVEAAGESRNPRAPAFRDLARQRSDAELSAAIAEISRNGHVEMPPIYVTPDELRAVVIYVRSLSARAT